MVYVGKFKKISGEAFFFSLHSWTGIVAIVMYFLQYAVGVYSHIAHMGLHALHQLCAFATLPGENISTSVH